MTAQEYVAIAVVLLAGAWLVRLLARGDEEHAGGCTSCRAEKTTMLRESPNVGDQVARFDREDPMRPVESGRAARGPADP